MLNSMSHPSPSKEKKLPSEDHMKDEIAHLTKHKYILREKILQLKEEVHKLDEGRQKMMLENASLEQDVKNALNALCIEKKITDSMREENGQLLRRKDKSLEVQIGSMDYKKLQQGDYKRNKTTANPINHSLKEKLEKYKQLDTTINGVDILMMMNVNKDALAKTIVNISKRLKPHFGNKLFDCDHLSKSLKKQMQEKEDISALDIGMIKLSHTMKIAVILLGTLSQKLISN